MSGSLLFPGAPALLNSALGATGSLPVLQVADALGLNSEAVLGQWGVYTQAGAPLFTIDSVISFSYTNDANVAKYPVEQGGFASYNKVQTPRVITMVVALSGTFTFSSLIAAGSALLAGNVTGAFTSLTGNAARSALITALQAAEASTTLLNVVTPEFVYKNFNVIHNDYARSAEKGATLLQIEIKLQEVRVVATQSYSNTQSPSGANPVNGGPTQASTPTSAQSSVATTTGAS